VTEQLDTCIVHTLPNILPGRNLVRISWLMNDPALNDLAQ